MLSPFRFAGAKNKLIPILKEYIDPILLSSQNYCEPFIGGGSVGLYVAQQYPNIKLFFNDKDPWISSFWSVVSGEYNQLQDLLTRIDQPATIEHFYKLSETPAITNIERAYRAIFYNRTCFSGIVKRDSSDKIKSSPIGGKNQNSSYKVNCRYNSKKLKDKIKICNQLLSGRTVVTNMDANEYLLTIDKSCPTYLDPPYFVKAHMLYNEFMLPEEHYNLSLTLQKRSNWIISYDDCEEIRNYYCNNNIIDLAARYCINGKKNNWENKNELIIIPK